VGEHLLRERPDAVLADRMPWIQAHGTVGLGAWSAERRLPGTAARPPLPASVLEDCRAVLVELFRLDADGRVPPRSCTADLHRIAAAVPADATAAAARLAAGADRVLADLPRGFGHGDFWSDNLLVESGRLTGVIDWDSAGPGRLPLLDLLHLLLGARQSVPGYRWGNAVLDVLRPWADRGADDLGRRYCRQLGLSTEPAVLRALVIAYWLDWLHYQFDRYADRIGRTRWMANNVVRVARTLDAAGWAQR
jgi:aminoglycoside phosphotransferase (APT) family kinase protein